MTLFKHASDIYFCKVYHERCDDTNQIIFNRGDCISCRIIIYPFANSPVKQTGIKRYKVQH